MEAETKKTELQVRFSFVLYITPCSSGRWDGGATEGQRLDAYGDGLECNAAAIATLFPGALMLVHVPRDELTKYAALRQFCTALCAKHAHVRIVEVDVETALSGGAMLMGQRLRCARYLPMFAPSGDSVVDKNDDADLLRAHAGIVHIDALGAPARTCADILKRADEAGGAGEAGETEKKEAGTGGTEGSRVSQGDFVPVVARDADSIVSAADAVLIREWLASGRRWLLYQEHKMGRGMPMGGGIACAVPVRAFSLADALASCGDGDWDEHAMSLAMPVDFWTHAHTRGATVSHGGVGATSFTAVRTRLARSDHWYTWSGDEGDEGTLLWPPALDTTELPPDTPSRQRWVR